MRIKFKKALLFIIVLPLTLILDLILYGLIKTCPTCGSFWDFVKNEGSISFPMVTQIFEYIEIQASGFKKKA